MPAQVIFLPQTLWDIRRVKNSTDSENEALFQSGACNVESVAMAAQNVSGKDNIKSIGPISEYVI